MARGACWSRPTRGCSTSCATPTTTTTVAISSSPKAELELLTPAGEGLRFFYPRSHGHDREPGQQASIAAVPEIAGGRRGRETDVEVTRRQFLQLGATSMGALGVSPLGFNLAKATRVKQRLRIEGATVSHSVCPYCAVGCAFVAYTKKLPSGKVELLQIEGDPDSPVSEGRLCPKGATALQLAVSRRRERRQPLRGHCLRRRRGVQLRRGVPGHQADARSGGGVPRTTGPCLTRSNGDQFGRHLWPRGHDQPLA